MNFGYAGGISFFSNVKIDYRELNYTHAFFANNTKCILKVGVLKCALSV